MSRMTKAWSPMTTLLKENELEWNRQKCDHRECHDFLLHHAFSSSSESDSIFMAGISSSSSPSSWGLGIAGREGNTLVADYPYDLKLPVARNGSTGGVKALAVDWEAWSGFSGVGMGEVAAGCTVTGVVGIVDVRVLAAIVDIKITGVLWSVITMSCCLFSLAASVAFISNAVRMSISSWDCSALKSERASRCGIDRTSGGTRGCKRRPMSRCICNLRCVKPLYFIMKAIDTHT